MSRRNRNRLLFAAASIAIVLLSCALQFNGLKGGAVIDDRRLFTDYEGRGCGADPAACFHNMMFGFYYRPVLSASIALGQKLHDNRPLWFHIENLVLHAITVALAIWLFRLLFRRRSAALVSGLIFALHPVQVCITTFVGGRTDTMVLLFITLFAIGARNAGRRIALLQRVNGPASRIRIGAWISLSVLGLLAAAFTKEQVIPLALLAPLLAAPLRRAARAAARKVDTSVPVALRRRSDSAPPYWTAIYLIPVGVFGLAAHNALHDVDFHSAGWPPLLQVEMVGRTIWAYARIFLFPTVDALHVTTLGAWDSPQIGAALCGWIAALLFVALLYWQRSARAMVIFWLWSALGLISCLNIIPIPTQFVSVYRAGIPLLGIAGLIGGAYTWLVTMLPLRPGESRRERSASPRLRRSAAAALALILLWFSVVSYRDVPNWSDEFALMKAEVAADPNFVCARAALASFDQQRGSYAEALRQFDLCIAELFGPGAPPEGYPDMLDSSRMLRAMHSASTLRYLPQQYIPQVVRERGRTLLLMGRPAEAVSDLRAALKMTPDDAVARGALAICYDALNQPERARAVRQMDDVLLGREL